MADQYLLAQTLLMQMGATMSEEDREARKADFIAELYITFPTLESLSGSEVGVEYHDCSEGVMMRVYLQRSSRGLFLSPQMAASHTDPFDEDVMGVKRDRLKAREQYQVALKGTVNPAADKKLVSLRRRLKVAASKGELIIFTTPQGERFRVNDVPDWMPQSRTVEIMFTAVSIQRSRVQVKLRDVQMPADMQPFPMDSSEFSRRSNVWLMRERGARGDGPGKDFSASLETGVILQATAHLDFRWVDGSLGRWTLYDAPEVYLENGERRFYQQADLLDLEQMPEPPTTQGSLVRKIASNDDDPEIWDSAA